MNSMARRAESEYVVRCDDLSVARGGTRVAEGVSLRLRPGTTLALMGPTGGGKSSVAALLAGANERGLGVDGGEGFVEGISLRRGGRARRVRNYITGYVAQGAGTDLPARLTVAETIGEPITSRDRRVNQRELSLRIAGLLDELELPLGAAGTYPYELSSGMRQRVAIARALLLQPKLFIGDDPYSNLDLRARSAVRDALIRRRDDYGMALLLVTNEPETVRELDADVLVLRAGHPVGFGHGTNDVLWTPDGGTRIAS